MIAMGQGLQELIKMVPPSLTHLHALGSSGVDMLIPAQQIKGSSFCRHSQMNKAAWNDLLPSQIRSIAKTAGYERQDAGSLGGRASGMHMNPVRIKPLSSELPSGFVERQHLKWLCDNQAFTSSNL